MASEEDVEAIRQLKARYCRLMDTKDWAGWRQLFTDDLIANTDSGPAKADGSHRHPEIADADRFVSFVIEALGDRPTVHHCHMPEIEILSDERARGIWAMEDVVQFPTGMLHGYGHYREEYRRIDGEWRIARLHLTRLRVDFTPGTGS